MKRWHFWMGAGVCFALAAVLAAWPAWGQARQGVLALAALATPGWREKQATSPTSRTAPTPRAMSKAAKGPRRRVVR